MISGFLTPPNAKVYALGVCSVVTGAVSAQHYAYRSTLGLLYTHVIVHPLYIFHALQRCPG
jgi:hypothetical protein